MDDILTPYEVAKELGQIHSTTAPPVLNSYFNAPRITDIKDTDRATNAFRAGHSLTNIYKDFEEQRTQGKTSSATEIFPTLLRTAGYGEAIRPTDPSYRRRPFDEYQKFVNLYHQSAQHIDRLNEQGNDNPRDRRKAHGLFELYDKSKPHVDALYKNVMETMQEQPGTVFSLRDLAAFTVMQTSKRKAFKSTQGSQNKRTRV